MYVFLPSNFKGLEVSPGGRIIDVFLYFMYDNVLNIKISSINVVNYVKFEGIHMTR